MGRHILVSDAFSVRGCAMVVAITEAGAALSGDRTVTEERAADSSDATVTHGLQWCNMD